MAAWWRRRRHTVRGRARAFNRARAKVQNYHEWMCPCCGKVSRGIDHPTRFLSGLKFPACCRRYCWHGWRSFYDDYIPSSECDLQPPEEFRP